MLNKTKSEYGLAYKINETHLTVSGQQRHRVKFAAQLLSKSCYNSLKYLGERGMLTSPNWKQTSHFILLMNDWFDILNSSSMYGDFEGRNAYGINLESQKDTLNKVIDVMKTMRVKTSKAKSLCKFQKGIIRSCKSTMALYEMLKASHNIEYMLTARLNQDCLEHFFGCIRQMHGTHDHPNAVNFKFRIKRLLLGKNIQVVSDKCNVAPIAESSFEPVSVNELAKEKEKDIALELYLT